MRQPSRRESGSAGSRFCTGSVRPLRDGLVEAERLDPQKLKHEEERIWDCTRKGENNKGDPWSKWFSDESCIQWLVVWCPVGQRWFANLKQSVQST